MRRSPGTHTTNNGWRVRHCKAGRGFAPRRARTATASRPAGDARRKVTAVRHSLLKTPHGGGTTSSLTISSHGRRGHFFSGICRSVVLAPIRTTSAQPMRRQLRVLRGRVGSGHAGDRKGAKIASGRHLAVTARRPRLSRHKYSNVLRDGGDIFDVKAPIVIRQPGLALWHAKRLSIGELTS